MRLAAAVATIRRRVGVAALACAALLSVGSGPAGGDETQQAGGLAVYLGVLPAAVVRGHAPEHAEGRMHGGVPATRGQRHVVVAIFDARTGARIDDASVTARVGEPGLAPVEKRLEPMPVNGAASYGNYFAMPGPARYVIDVRIAHPARGGAVAVRFDHAVAAR